MRNYWGQIDRELCIPCDVFDSLDPAPESFMHELREKAYFSDLHQWPLKVIRVVDGKVKPFDAKDPKKILVVRRVPRRVRRLGEYRKFSFGTNQKVWNMLGYGFGKDPEAGTHDWHKYPDWREEQTDEERHLRAQYGNAFTRSVIKKYAVLVLMDILGELVHGFIVLVPEPVRLFRRLWVDASPPPSSLKLLILFISLALAPRAPEPCPVAAIVSNGRQAGVM